MASLRSVETPATGSPIPSEPAAAIPTEVRPSDSEATVATMEKLGAKRERTVAVIGPSISQRAYEVGADYMERFLAEEPGSEVFFVTDDSSGEPHFDLAGYVAERLSRAGVGTVSDLGLCTYCDETRLFSYRRSQHHGEEDYGRQISAIVLT